MNNSPLVSVVIPTYNREKTIERAINSVLYQTYKNVEIIVVDNCSNDNTKDLVKEMTRLNSNIKYFYTDIQGASNARNIGIKESQGEFISFLDSDDEYLKNKIETNISIYNKTNYQFYISNYFSAYPNGNVKKKKLNKKSGIITSEDIINVNIGISASTYFIKKTLLKNNINFNNEFPSSNDYDFILRISQITDIYYISDPLLYIYKTLNDKYRISNNYNTKIKGYNKMIESLENGLYFKDSKCHYKLLYHKVLTDLGMFYILNGDLTIGRKTLFLSAKYGNLAIKHIIFFAVSLSKLSSKIFNYLIKIFWEKGIFFSALLFFLHKLYLTILLSWR